MKEIVSANKRDIARELARRYSTMTHDELDILESILVSQKYAKGEMILKEGEICRQFLYIDKGLVRQFYFKHGKEVTEHLGQEQTIVMCIESLFKVSLPSFRWKLWSLLLSMLCRKRISSVLPCIMSTFRYCIVKSLRRVLSYRRYMPTLFASRRHKTVIRSCASSVRRWCCVRRWCILPAICR